MKNVIILFAASVALAAILLLSQQSKRGMAHADDSQPPQTEGRADAVPDKPAVERSRETVKLLDNVFKQTIVLVTDKYVHDEDDFAAGSAAVLLFKNVSEDGPVKVRLIDATGDPYDPENVAKDAFEEEGIKRLKDGAAIYDQVTHQDGKPYLRSLTAVPVVMEKCIMCHSHYADVKKGAPIGAISYTVPIE